MYDIMVKTTARSFHHDLAMYLDMAHQGQQIVVTKRGKPWVTIMSAPQINKPKKPKKLDWNKVFERTRENFKGRKVEAVKALLEMRDEERW